MAITHWRGIAASAQDVDEGQGAQRAQDGRGARGAQGARGDGDQVRGVWVAAGAQGAEHDGTQDEEGQATRGGRALACASDEAAALAPPTAGLDPASAGAAPAVFAQAEPGSLSLPRFNRHMSAAVEEQIVTLRQQGLTVAQIAQRVSFHRETVSKHLKRAGLTLRTDPADPGFQAQVRQIYSQLGTVKHTALQLGVSKHAVQKALQAV